jgi:predicted DNA-binding transcriptional regulator YafY
VHTANTPKLRRLLLVDREVRSGTFPTADRLAQLAEVNVRTIGRDIALLRNELGAPLEFCRQRNGWRYTCDTFQLPHLRISEGELLALFLAERTLAQFRGTPYEADLHRAVRKLELLLPDRVTLHWESAAAAHSFRTSVTSPANVETFRRLAAAVLNRRQLRIVYWTASRDEVGERIVDPWHLANIDGEWYLVGHCHLRNGRRTFAPARIRSLDETGETFVVPDDFDPADLAHGTFKVIAEDARPLRRIRLRFTGDAPRYIAEKSFCPSQQNFPRPDGSLVVQLELRSFIEVRRWIMSWGGECEVLAPIELRQDVEREATAIVQRATCRDESRHTGRRSAAKRKGAG